MMGSRCIWQANAEDSMRTKIKSICILLWPCHPTHQDEYYAQSLLRTHLSCHPRHSVRDIGHKGLMPYVTVTKSGHTIIILRAYYM